MSDAVQPTVAEVRAAAEAVKAALDRHLDAIENRTGEDDPAVYAAFDALASAAETYDELLYDAYDEVTPFEVPSGDVAARSTRGREDPEAISVLIRRDYTIVEPSGCFAQAERWPRDGDAASERRRSTGCRCRVRRVRTGRDRPRHKEFGLEEGDSTVWVSAVASLPSRGSGWTPPSTRRTRSWWSAASTSAPSSTTNWAPSTLD